MPLEESIALYERGAALHEHCARLLDSAEAARAAPRGGRRRLGHGWWTCGPTTADDRLSHGHAARPPGPGGPQGHQPRRGACPVRGAAPDHHRDRRPDRRPPGQLARRRGAHRRAPPRARQPDRPHRLGHRAPGLRSQAAHGPAGALRHAAPAGRRGRLPAAHRERPRCHGRRPRRHGHLHRRRPRPGARSAWRRASASRSSSATRRS